MSYTALDDDIRERSDVIAASPESLRQLAGIPASFRLAGMMVLRARRGSVRFDLPDGRKVLFDHGQKGPHAVIEVLFELLPRRRVHVAGLHAWCVGLKNKRTPALEGVVYAVKQSLTVVDVVNAVGVHAGDRIDRSGLRLNA